MDGGNNIDLATNYSGKVDKPYKKTKYAIKKSKDEEKATMKLLFGIGEKENDKTRND